MMTCYRKALVCVRLRELPEDIQGRVLRLYADLDRLEFLGVVGSLSALCGIPIWMLLIVAYEYTRIIYDFPLPGLSDVVLDIGMPASVIAAYLIARRIARPKIEVATKQLRSTLAEQSDLLPIIEQIDPDCVRSVRKHIAG